jgi:hypothetical protein
MSKDKKGFHFVFVTEEDTKRETIELAKNIKEENITNLVFNGEHLYKTGGRGHSFGLGFYEEHITKSGIRATFYINGWWRIGREDYKHNTENNEFELIPKSPTAEINWDNLSFPIVKNVSARTLAQDIKPYAPKQSQ